MKCTKNYRNDGLIKAPDLCFFGNEVIWGRKSLSAYVLVFTLGKGRPMFLPPLSHQQNRLEIERLRALSPLIYAHVNPYDRFKFNMSTRLPLD